MTTEPSLPRDRSVIFNRETAFRCGIATQGDAIQLGESISFVNTVPRTEDFQLFYYPTDIFYGTPVTRAIVQGGLKKKKHILDRKYPHVCFECQTPLKFQELLDANSCTAFLDVDMYKRMKKLWRSRVIEFYCCLCYLRLELK